MRDAKDPVVSLIVAVSENGVIGRDGQLPWRLPADLARFKQLTVGHPIVMGRKTYESIGRPLPGRLSVVLTRDASWQAGHDGVLVASDLRSAISAAESDERFSDEEAFVIGGGEIYRTALPIADRVYRTRVLTRVEGDATFPELSENEWRLVESEAYRADEQNEHSFDFEVWERTCN